MPLDPQHDVCMWFCGLVREVEFCVCVCVCGYQCYCAHMFFSVCMYVFVAGALSLSAWLILPWFGFILSLTTDLFHCPPTITLIKPLCAVPGSAALSQKQCFKNNSDEAVWFKISGVALLSVLGVDVLWIRGLDCISIRRWADLRFWELMCS